MRPLSRSVTSAVLPSGSAAMPQGIDRPDASTCVVAAAADDVAPRAAGAGALASATPVGTARASTTETRIADRVRAMPTSWKGSGPGTSAKVRLCVGTRNREKRSMHSNGKGAQS